MQASSWTERYQMAGAAPRGDALEAFRAVDANGRQLTIKVTRPRDPQQFFQMASALAHVDHPNVVRVVDWGQDGDLCWVATEHVDGLDLQSVLSREQRLSPEAAASIGQQAAAGLAALHAAGIVHGGVASHTAIRGYDGVVKLTDVGLRTAVAPIDMGKTTPAAVAWYASPEEALGQPVVPASDQYSLGLVLYELCTGRRAFDGPDAFTVADLQVGGMPQAPHALAPGVPAALENVIKRALQKRPEQRYPTTDDMRRELLALGGAVIAEPPTVVLPPVAPSQAASPMSPPTAAPRAPAPLPVEEEKRRSRTGLIIALVLLVIVAAVLVAWALGVFGGGGVAVPDLVGRNLSQATTALTDAGLTVGDVGYADGSTADTPGVAVSKQSPKAGVEVDEGTAVDLTMSADLVTVDDVRGQTEAAAVNALTQAGLKLDRVQRRQSDQVDSGLVIDQTPRAGTQVPKGSTFTLVVSTGAAPATVPDVEGESQESAEQSLQDAGYTVNVVEQPSDTVPAGIVIQQNPSAGVEAAKGSRVTIVVSTGPTSSPTPTASPSPTV